MREVKGNIWDYHRQPGFVVVITTNGEVKRNGDAVMGKGVALEATKRIPNIASELGKAMQIAGNQPIFLDNLHVLTFPTKFLWREQSDITLISMSAGILRRKALINPTTVFAMPRPGCGCGGLQWKDVRPLLLKLPDNVWVVHKDRN